MRAGGQARSAVATMAVHGVEIVAQLAVSIMVARRLGPEGFGQFVFAMGVAGLLGVLMQFGTGDVAIKMLVEAPHQTAEVVAASRRIVRRGGRVAAGLAGAIGLAVGLELHEFVQLGLAIAVLSVHARAAVLNNVILARGWSPRDFVVVALARAGMVAGAWFALGGGGVTAVLLVQLASASVLVAGRGLLVFGIGGVAHPRFDDEVSRRIWRRGAHVGIGSVFGSLSARSDVLLLKGLTDAHQLGLHGAAARLLKGLVALGLGLAAALYPEVARAQRQGRRWWLGLALPSLGLASLAIASIHLAPWLVERVFGPAMADATPVARVLLAAGAAQAVIAFVAKAAILRGCERALPPIQALGAALNVGLNVLLIPRAGALGAAWATLVGDTVVLGALAFATLSFGRRTPASPGARP